MKKLLLLLMLSSSISYSQEIELYTDSFIMNGDTITTSNSCHILTFTIDLENSKFIQENVDGNIFENNVEYFYNDNVIKIKDNQTIVLLELDKDTSTFVMRSNFNTYYIGNYKLKK